jgi:hypothetical protein
MRRGLARSARVAVVLTCTAALYGAGTVTAASGAVMTTAGPATAGGAHAVPTPSVSPVNAHAGSRGAPIDATTLPLGSLGYSEREYFLAGTTKSYAPLGTWGRDGRWPVTVTATGLPYTTRILVRRPTDPKRFSGKVVVEWLNDTGVVDSDPDWGQAHDQILRDGDAWVGVTVQTIGVGALKVLDNSRYHSLDIGSESQTYDIFSQAGQAVRHDSQLLLGSQKPLILLGAGQSQSAGWLTTYANAIQPLAQIYDGLLIHSRFSNTPISSGQGFVREPLIRADLGVPVLQLETETDLGLGFLGARQPDTSRLRTWEIAGSAHFDQYGLAVLEQDIGPVIGLPVLTAAEQQKFFGCLYPANNLQLHFVADTAVHDLGSWAAGGPPPPTAAPIATTAAGEIMLDANGNALGGLRSPDIQVPTATYGPTGPGAPNAEPLAPFICMLLGSTSPFSAAKLASLYPTHQSYVQQVTAAAKADARRGYLLPADVHAIIARAKAAKIGRPGS